MCKCQLCSFCTGVCSSGLLGDSKFASCEPGCDAAHAADHCRYCRCQGCKLCDASPPPPFPPALAPAPVAARVVAPRGAACASLAPGDLPFESCEQPTCGAAPSPDACATCRCKGCTACGGSMGGALVGTTAAPPPLPLGTSVCSSRWKDDVGASECQAFCDHGQKDIHCTLCGVERLARARVSPRPLGGTTAAPACAARSRLHVLDVCALGRGRCKCTGCDWCGDVPLLPEPTTSSASEASAPACSSIVRGDTEYKSCMFVCSATFAPVMCLMCRCALCSFCQRQPSPGSGGHLAPIGAPPPPSCTSQAIGRNRRWDIDHEECQSYCEPASSAIHCEHIEARPSCLLPTSP